MDRDIEGAVRRTAGYWFADGFAEMAAGAVLAVLALPFLVEAVVPGAPRSLSAFGLMVLVPLGAWVAKRVVARAKERHTYPRTGRVVYRRPSPLLRAAVVGIGALIGMVTAAGLVRLLQAQAGIASWLPLLQGVAGAAMLLQVGRSAGLPRLYVAALFSVALGGALSLVELNASAAGAIYLTAMGAALAVSGAVARHGYLREAPPAEEA